MASGLPFSYSSNTLPGIAFGEGLSLLNPKIPCLGRSQVGVKRVDEGILQDRVCVRDV